VKSVAESYGVTFSDVGMDTSGVWPAVMGGLRRGHPGCPLAGVVGGRTTAAYATVSRTELLTKLQMMVQERRFRVDKTQCREWDALRRELMVLKLEGKPRARRDDLALPGARGVAAVR